MKDLPKAPPMAERNRMAIAFMESACFKGEEVDEVLVALIRKGMAIFEAPDLFRITEEGYQEQIKAAVEMNNA